MVWPLFFPFLSVSSFTPCPSPSSPALTPSDPICLLSYILEVCWVVHYQISSQYTITESHHIRNPSWGGIISVKSYPRVIPEKTYIGVSHCYGQTQDTQSLIYGWSFYLLLWYTCDWPHSSIYSCRLVVLPLDSSTPPLYRCQVKLTF